MCKLFSAIGVSQKPEAQKALRRLIKALPPELGKYDKDGYGEMVIYQDGSSSWEKWVNMRDIHKKRRLSSLDQDIVCKYGIHIPEKYAGTALEAKPIQVFSAHARIATNAVCIENTHPFVKGNTLLMHNGVVSSQKYTLQASTCDSELLLNGYVEEKLCADYRDVQNLADNINGYYACIVYSKHDDTWQVDVLKSARAQLYLFYSPILECYIFCTEARIIRAAAKKAKVKISEICYPVPSSYIVRHICTGEVVGHTNFVEKIDAKAQTSFFTSSDFKNANASILEEEEDKEEDFCSGCKHAHLGRENAPCYYCREGSSYEYKTY